MKTLLLLLMAISSHATVVISQPATSRPLTGTVDLTEVATATTTLQANINTEASVRLSTDIAIGASTAALSGRFDTVATDTNTLASIKASTGVVADITRLNGVTIIGSSPTVLGSATFQGAGLFYGQVTNTLGIVTTGLGNGTIVGNARGIGSNDLQTSRSIATEVASGQYVTASGKRNIGSGNNSTVFGLQNTSSGAGSTVGGGGTCSATNSYATVGGGTSNGATGLVATVSGGSQGTASGSYSTVPGGILCTASGDYSFAAGRRAKATADGSFVLADSTDADFTASIVDQLKVRFQGGFFVEASSSSFGQGAARSTFTVEGALTLGGALRPSIKTKAQFDTITPVLGDSYLCSDCAVPYDLCVATGATISGFRATINSAINTTIPGTLVPKGCGTGN